MLHENNMSDAGGPIGPPVTTPGDKGGLNYSLISDKMDVSMFDNQRPTICFGRIIIGEITPLLAAMRRTVPRWSSHQLMDADKDPLVMKLEELSATITALNPDDTLDPNTFLDPFLAVIRSEDTTGPVTKIALASVNRILNYGLISPECSSASASVESVAAAVTHARFVGTDQGADEVVLWEILTVLRTLMLGPVGHLLTNESVCEILNSSFRICFETRLSELLRNCTEEALRHMVQLLFARLPQFKDDPRGQAHSKRLKMRAGGESSRRKGKKNSGRPTPTPTPPPPDIEVCSEDTPDITITTIISTIQPADGDSIAKDEMTSSTTGISPSGSEPESLSVGACDPPATDTASVDSGILEAGTPGERLDVSHTHLAPNIYSSLESIPSAIAETDGACISVDIEETLPRERSETNTSHSSAEVITAVDVGTEGKTDECSSVPTDQISPEDQEEFINSQGVKFTQEGVSIEGGALVPYGMPCVKEVFRFLISLTSPTNEQNSPAMILTSLNLLIVAFEVGAEHINNTPSLLGLLKDQLYRHLLMLLKPDVRLTIFMASLRCCALLCEALRSHFKFQLEMLLNKLSDIITSEAPSVSYAHKKLALETVVQLWRIPGLITELFLNFDCDLYASNLFEDLTKVLSKNAFPVQGIYSTNLLSLDGLITVIDIIESHSNQLRESKEVKQKSDTAPLVLSQASSGYLLGLGLRGGFCPVTPVLKARSVLVDSTEVSRENLVALKEKKKLLAAGTDQFNVKPEKGIKFLQDNNIMGLSNDDIAVFLKENPKLCKKQIGEYISKKKNVDILSAFVNSFEFREQRVDQSLRSFLEAFRLPGEAPVISIIIEHFSDHWHTSNNEPFAKADAAFTLAYAVIMLNVDQHNQNAKKQNVPMTVDQFRKNLRGVNEGKDFDPDMLEEIYDAIKSDEIVMPAEQVGLVKENYMWKMLLKRGTTKEGKYILANSNITFDRDLFTLCWGPTIASLSYVFDKSTDEQIIQRSLEGFHKCASIAARFGMSDVFDNMIISLCKFTTLTATSAEVPEQIVIAFGANKKAQEAAKTVFQLVTTHGDILRDGWKNILDLLLQLFKCRLLPPSLVESEDFVETTGKVLLMRETPVVVPRQESNFLSSFTYFVLGDGGAARGTSPEDAEYTQAAKACLIGCHPEKLITESAFLRCDSLTELLKALMGAGDASTMHEQGITPGGGLLQEDGQPQGLDEHCQAFLLECVVQVMIANKDRASLVWQEVRNHIYSIMMGAAAAERHFLLERCVVSLLRLAKVLLRRPGLANQVLQSLRMLLLLKPHVLSRVALHIVTGIREVLSVNTEHIHAPSDWAVLFNLLECAGAGAKPPSFGNPTDAPQATTDTGSMSESEVCSSGVDSGHCSEAGTTSDSDVHSTEAKPSTITEHKQQPQPQPQQQQQQRAASPDTLNNGPGGWILVGRGGEIEPQAIKVSINEFDIVHQRELGDHRPEALVQAFDTLAFLVRDNRITPASLPAAVQAARTFVEATLNGGKSGQRPGGEGNVRSPTRRRAGGRRKEEKGSKRSKSPSMAANAYDADESDSDDMPQNYQHLSERLLDLLDNLHTSSGKIVAMNSETLESSLMLWHQALCPLLQGIARYCCDSRAQIRNMAMTNLQRALLNHDLQTLNAAQWEACFNKVLFPLLAALLQPLPGASPSSLEETRVRAATLVQKVYLRHLTPLLALPTFTALWLTVLDFMDKYLNTHRSDHLNDAIPEILKNMLLVMETTQVFHTADGFTRLWTITWDRIDAFLPDFRHELFKTHPPSEIHPIEVVPESSKPPPSESSEVPTATTSHPVPGPVPATAPPQMSLPLAPPMAPPPVAPQQQPGSPQSTDHIAQTTPGSPNDTPNEVDGMSPTTRDPKEGFVPPTLREQEAARLSLSQDSLPGPCSVILQPPIPTLTNPLPTLTLASPTSPQATGSPGGPPIQSSAFATPNEVPVVGLMSRIPPTQPHHTPHHTPAITLGSLPAPLPHFLLTTSTPHTNLLFTSPTPHTPRTPFYTPPESLPYNTVSNQISKHSAAAVAPPSVPTLITTPDSPLVESLQTPVTSDVVLNQGSPSFAHCNLGSSDVQEPVINSSVVDDGDETSMAEISIASTSINLSSESSNKSPVQMLPTVFSHGVEAPTGDEFSSNNSTPVAAIDISNVLNTSADTKNSFSLFGPLNSTFSPTNGFEMGASPIMPPGASQHPSTMPKEPIIPSFSSTAMSTEETTTAEAKSPTVPVLTSPPVTNSPTSPVLTSLPVTNSPTSPVLTSIPVTNSPTSPILTSPHVTNSSTLPVLASPHVTDSPTTPVLTFPPATNSPSAQVLTSPPAINIGSTPSITSTPLADEPSSHPPPTCPPATAVDGSKSTTLQSCSPPASSSVSPIAIPTRHSVTQQSLSPPSSSSIFPLTIPSFLNPFASEELPAVESPDVSQPVGGQVPAPTPAPPSSQGTFPAPTVPHVAAIASTLATPTIVQAPSSSIKESSPSPLRPASILFCDSPDSDFLVDPNACQGPSPLTPPQMVPTPVEATPAASKEGSFDSPVPNDPLILSNAGSVNPQPISILPISPQQVK